jgi:hypothetical protein
MRRLTLITAAFTATCTTASAQDLLITGQVQRVILQPSGTTDCPPPCPALATMHPDGSQTICISNGGGCQTMEVKVDRVYRGTTTGSIRQFKSRIGEWGPSFPVTDKQIVVSEEAGLVSWSLVTLQDGKIHIDPTRLRSIGGVPTAPTGESGLVELDEILARSSLARDKR